MCCCIDVYWLNFGGSNAIIRMELERKSWENHILSNCCFWVLQVAGTGSHVGGTGFLVQKPERDNSDSVGTGYSWGGTGFLVKNLQRKMHFLWEPVPSMEEPSS